LPVVDAVALDYADTVRFVAVAGQSDFDSTKARADELLANTDWGPDESVWDLYGVRGQPVSFFIAGNGVVVGKLVRCGRRRSVTQSPRRAGSPRRI